VSHHFLAAEQHKASSPVYSLLGRNSPPRHQNTPLSLFLSGNIIDEHASAVTQMIMAYSFAPFSI
jgi:hypothetical protein